jgi:hypothetical protein
VVLAVKVVAEASVTCSKLVILTPIVTAPPPVMASTSLSPAPALTLSPAFSEAAVAFTVSLPA